MSAIFLNLLGFQKKISILHLTVIAFSLPSIKQRYSIMWLILAIHFTFIFSDFFWILNFYSFTFLHSTFIAFFLPSIRWMCSIMWLIIASHFTTSKLGILHLLWALLAFLINFLQYLQKLQQPNIFASDGINENIRCQGLSTIVFQLLKILSSHIYDSKLLNWDFTIMLLKHFNDQHSFWRKLYALEIMFFRSLCGNNLFVANMGHFWLQN